MAIDAIVSFVQQHGPQLVAHLTAEGGLTRAEAERFVPTASTTFVQAAKSGGLDALVDGGVDALRDRFDLTALAVKTNIEESKIGAALAAFLPALLEIGVRGSGSLQRLLGDAGSADLLAHAGPIAKKFFPQA